MHVCYARVVVTGQAQQPLRPLPRPRLYEALIQRLLEYVALSDMRPGERFPPERQLAGQLGVSRNSVKQAMVALEVQGVVQTRQGDGTYLRRTDSETLARLLDRRRRLPDILEAREALECKLAELAAQRRASEDLDAMELALERMEDDIRAGGLGAEGDASFHRAVAAAAHSAVLAQLMASISGPVHETRMESLSEPGRGAKSLAAHRRIVVAIRASDPKAASAAMRSHLRIVANVFLLRATPLDHGSPGHSAPEDREPRVDRDRRAMSASAPRRAATTTSRVRAG
jgi:GntR family transcriptional repressor for pyruvate dehydrogenase complex